MRVVTFGHFAEPLVASERQDEESTHVVRREDCRKETKNVERLREGVDVG